MKHNSLYTPNAKPVNSGRGVIAAPEFKMPARTTAVVELESTGPVMSEADVRAEIKTYHRAANSQKQNLLRLFDGQAHKRMNCANFPKFCADFLGIYQNVNYIYYVLSAARVERRLLPPPADGEAPAKMPIRRATMLAKLNDYPIHQDRAWREFQALEQQATRTAANLDQGLKLIVDRQLLQIAKDQFHKNNPLTIESSSPADRQSRQIVGTVSPSPDTDAPAPMTANTPHEEEPATYDMGDMADAFQTALAWIENERIDADRAVLEWVDDAIANFQAWKRAQHSVPASLA